MAKETTTHQAPTKITPQPSVVASSPQFATNPWSRLQRTVGNQAVLRLMRDGRLQAKLRSRSSSDRYELEADRAADAVASGAQARPALSETAAIRRKESPSHPTISDHAGGSVAQVLHSSGQPLDAEARSTMQSRFGADFSNVHVHTGKLAAESAESLGALAYTVGNHVVFAEGQYQPGSSAGQKLLAHELAHVVQQSRGSGSAPTRDGSGPLETAAQAAAASLAQTKNRVNVQGSSAPGIACQPDEQQSLFSRGLSFARSITPARVVQAVESKYEATKQDVVAIVDQVKNKYAFAKDVVVEKVKQFNTPENREKALEVAKRVANPSILLADATSAAKKATEERAAKAKGDPQAEAPATASNRLMTQLDKLSQASAKLDTEPSEKFGQALVKDGFVAAVKAWQKSKDENLENLTKEFKQTVNDYEDGKFEPEPQPSIDPKAHPTLAKIESGLTTADQFVNKAGRQVGGGVTKALWSMGTGITNIFVHPVRTVRGLGELPSVPGTPNVLGPVADAVGIIDDLATSDKPAMQVLNEHGEQAKFDPKRELEKTRNLAKSLGENYIDAVHASRYGEIPGLLLVDVGSFFIPGGEATKAGDVLKAAGTTGDVSKALATTGEVTKAVTTTGELTKTVETVGELGKTVETTSEASKALGTTTDVSQAAGTAGDVSRAGGTASDVGKEVEAASGIKEAKPLPSDAAPQALEPKQIGPQPKEGKLPPPERKPAMPEPEPKKTEMVEPERKKLELPEPEPKKLEVVEPEPKKPEMLETEPKAADTKPDAADTAPKEAASESDTAKTEPKADTEAKPSEPQEKPQDAESKPSDSEPQKTATGAEKPEVPEATGPTKAERAQLQKDVKNLKARQKRAQARMNGQYKLAKSEAARAKELRRSALVEKDAATRSGMYKEAQEADNTARKALADAEATKQKVIDNQLELQKKQLQLSTDLRSKLPCFASGTNVLTPAGSCPIEQLRQHDMVLAYDFQTSSLVSRQVLELFRNRTGRFYSIAVHGERILATSLHRFWVGTEQKWVEARHLRAGMQLLSHSGETLTISSISISESPGAETFNLHVEQFPNYFVGTGVLVHNAGAPSYNFGNLSIYEGVNPKFPGKIYIGQTDDIIVRQGQHRAEAEQALQKPGLSAEEREFWEFKRDIVLKRRVSGLNADQANYLEQTNMDLETGIRGENNVMNRREQVSRKNMVELEERIKADPKVQAEGLCP